MTLELVDWNRVPGYAGPLHALRHPDLANRFHFWRGASGRRYACTRFPSGRMLAYEHAISLHVRRRGGEASVIGIGRTPDDSIPLGTDEIHVHFVQGDANAFAAAYQDLSALVVRRPRLQLIERRAA